MALISVQQAAATLGVSAASVYKALKAGRLPVRRVGNRLMLERDGLAARWHGSSQRRRVVPQSAAPGPDWVAISERANEMLDCAAWGPPPWPADRWATLAMVISLAEEQAAA
jgi:excisionase family DNA binding protein